MSDEVKFSRAGDPASFEPSTPRDPCSFQRQPDGTYRRVALPLPVAVAQYRAGTEFIAAFDTEAEAIAAMRLYAAAVKGSA